MKIKAIGGNIMEMGVGGIIVNLFEGVKSPGGASGAVDKALDEAISTMIARGRITGKLNEVTLIPTLGKIPPEMVAVVGLGKQSEFSIDRIRQVTAAACRALRSAEARTAATILHGAGAGGIAPETSAQAIVEGALLGLYTFRKHMTKKPEHRDLTELLIVERDEKRLPILRKAIRTGTILAEAASLARDMVNQPANLLTPADMARMAQDIARRWNLGFEVLERAHMERLGMGGLLGVSQGSDQPPKFIILKYEGDERSKKHMALVGKGLTFDSGGISLKPSENMDEMKGDMAGGASVIATLSALGQLKPRINVTGLIPATENLPSGRALKPGDIIKAMNGKTIEVVNTDAEGRLILADALSYAVAHKLSPIVDIATLTGACHVALGDICTGVFATDQALADRIIRAGEDTGERMWPMPMHPEYKELNKSDVADIKNSGGRWGGAITAAQFLSEFVGNAPWAHLDIAGTFMLSKERGYFPKGATGIPVRTLIHLILGMAEK